MLLDTGTELNALYERLAEFLASAESNISIPAQVSLSSTPYQQFLPGLRLEKTQDLVRLRLSVVYFYPMTGRPDAPPMVGWNEIPGARGCTPQSCSFRDHHADLLKLGAKVYGVSSQSTEDQKEAVHRLHLPFALLSDRNFELVTALRLLTFTYNSLRLIKRLTPIIKNGSIRKVFYPVFPPNENAANVIAWLHKNDG